MGSGLYNEGFDDPDFVAIDPVATPAVNPFAGLGGMGDADARAIATAYGADLGRDATTLENRLGPSTGKVTTLENRIVVPGSGDPAEVLKNLPGTVTDPNPGAMIKPLATGTGRIGPNGEIIPDDTALDPRVDPAVVKVGGGPAATSSATSVGGTYFNDGTFGYLTEGKAGKGLQGRIQAAENERIRQANQAIEGNNAAAAGLMDAERQAAEARDAAQLAAKGDPTVARDAVTEAGKAFGIEAPQTTGAAARAAIQAQLAVKEQEIAQQQMAMVQAKRADYEAAVNRVKAAQINPNRLFANQGLAFGLQNATSMLMMISGKPGMMAAGQALNQGIVSAVQRDVDAQMENLRKNQFVADGFKNIYDMVVRENDTANVAREKVLGAYMASVEGWLEAEMGKYDSKIIQADLAKALAGINAARIDTNNKIAKDYIEIGQRDADRLSREAQTFAQIAVQKADLAERKASREQAGRLAAQERQDKLIAALQKGVVASPFASDGDKIIGIAKAGSEEKVADLTASTATLMTRLEKLRGLADKLNESKDAGNIIGGITGFGALGDEYMAEATVLRSLITEELAKLRGGPITKGDQEFVETYVPLDPGLARTSAKVNYDKLTQQIRQRWEDSMAQHMVAPHLYTPEQRAVVEAGISGFTGEGIGVGEKKVADERDDERKQKPSTEASRAYAGAITNIDNRDSRWVPGDAAPEIWKRYAETPEGKFYGDTEQGRSVIFDGVQGYRVPDWLPDLTRLGYLAGQGNQEALDQLALIAGNDKSPGGMVAEQAEYALWLMNNPPTREDTDYMDRYAKRDERRKAVREAANR